MPEHITRAAVRPKFVTCHSRPAPARASSPQRPAQSRPARSTPVPAARPARTRRRCRGDGGSTGPNRARWRSAADLIGSTVNRRRVRRDGYGPWVAVNSPPGTTYEWPSMGSVSRGCRPALRTGRRHPPSGERPGTLGTSRRVRSQTPSALAVIVSGGTILSLPSQRNLDDGEVARLGQRTSRSSPSRRQVSALPVCSSTTCRGAVASPGSRTSWSAGRRVILTAVAPPRRIASPQGCGPNSPGIPSTNATGSPPPVLRRYHPARRPGVGGIPPVGPASLGREFVRRDLPCQRAIHPLGIRIPVGSGVRSRRGCNDRGMNPKIPAVVVADVDDELLAEAFVLDVREPDEWNRGHIEGATHIPLGQLQQRVGEVPLDQKVICVCAVGGRSCVATQSLCPRAARRSTSTAGCTPGSPSAARSHAITGLIG